MKNYLYTHVPDPKLRAIEKVKAVEELRRTGTDRIPQAPRDVFAQGSSRAVYVTWKLPVVYSDIVGWRIYKGDENTMVAEISDRATRNYTVPATAGASPPAVSIFVSAISTKRESPKIQVISAAAAEAGGATPPSIPTPPPGYTDEAAGSVNKTSGREPREPRDITAGGPRGASTD